MAATHGAGQDPTAVHTGPSNAYNQKLAQHLGDNLFALQIKSWVRIGKTKSMGSEVRTAKVWNRRYERGPIRIHSILSIYARMAPQERAVHRVDRRC